MYDGTVSVIDNSTDKVIKTTKVEGEPNGISYR
jgi:YVTN family beta-propeller protein